MKEYITTKEQCEAMIAKLNHVCPYCGNSNLVALETVDNADRPTHWTACMMCNHFTNGCKPEHYAIAKELVLNHSVTAYSHLGSDYGLEGLKLEMWRESQIGGVVDIVRKVLNVAATIKELNNVSIH